MADELGVSVSLLFLDRSNLWQGPDLDPDAELENGYKLTEPIPADVYPVDIQQLDDDYFYDLIEVFHDLVARPRKSYFHDFAGCGYHYSSFAIEPGQRLYRWKVNRLLESQQVDLRLADEGEFEGRLMEITDEARAELTTIAVTNASEERSSVEHAIGLFQRRSASSEEKRSAILVLARILEDNRDLLRASLGRADEGALFNIANNFDLRHNRADQRGDYDDAFLDWIFWWYLATVELAQRLIDRKSPKHDDG